MSRPNCAVGGVLSVTLSMCAALVSSWKFLDFYEAGCGSSIGKVPFNDIIRE